MNKPQRFITDAEEFWLLSIAASLQIMTGGIVYQAVEGFDGGALATIASSFAYMIPSLAVAALAILVGKHLLVRLIRSPFSSTATTLVFTIMAATNIAAGCLVLGLEGLELLTMAMLGSALFGFVLYRFTQKRFASYSHLLASAFGWIGLGVVVVDVSTTYQLLPSISGRIFDPNALLFAALIFLLTLAGIAMSAWFWATEKAQEFGSRNGFLSIGGALALFWLGMVVWNRVSLVPRLYPEVHGAIAFFELFLLLGALRWIQLGSPRLTSKKFKMMASVLPAILALVLLVLPQPTNLVPRRVDFTAQFFSKPWVWLFDRDSDGYLPLWLGGADCDNSNPASHSLGREIPKNGVDESCSGDDLGDVETQQVTTVSMKSDLTILVTIDMLRPDFMSVYGFEEPTTPILESLQHEFTRFDNAYASGGITTLALPSVLRGRIPMAIDFEHVYRTVDLGYVFPDERKPEHRVNRVFLSPRSDENPTIADVFSEAGRSTYAIIDDGPGSIFRKGFGFEKGFQQVYYPNEPEGPGYENWGSREITDAFLKTVQDAPNGSFLWVHYYDPHNAHPPCRKFPSTKGLGCYRDAIADIDKMIGEVVDEMQRLGRWRESTMIITSDHGEALGEHGLFHHGLDSYEEFVRIPLLIKSPLTTTLPRTSAVPVSLIDASLSSVVAGGLVPPSTFQGEDLHRILQGEERRFPVISQLLIMEVNGTPVRQQSLLVQGTQRFMWDRVTGRTWYFDLANDPAQLGHHGDQSTREDFRRELRKTLDVMEAKTF